MLEGIHIDTQYSVLLYRLVESHRAHLGLACMGMVLVIWQIPAIFSSQQPACCVTGFAPPATSHVNKASFSC